MDLPLAEHSKKDTPLLLTFAKPSACQVERAFRGDSELIWSTESTYHTPSCPF